MYWLIDDKNIACDNRNIKFEHLHLGFDIFMIFKWSIYCGFYYYVDGSNNSLIVQWSIKNVIWNHNHYCWKAATNKTKTRVARQKIELSNSLHCFQKFIIITKNQHKLVFVISRHLSFKLYWKYILSLNYIFYHWLFNINKAKNPTKFGGKHWNTSFFHEVVDYSEGGGHTFVNCWFQVN